MTGRVSTGLTGLDAQFGGGLPRGSAVVVVGPPMNALELLAYHFCDGAEDVSYYTTGRDADDITEAMHAIGLSTDDVHFLDISGMIPEVDAGGRIIVDNISDMWREQGEEATMDFLEDVKQAARAAEELAIILVLDGMHTEVELTRLRAWADGAMDLGIDRQGFGLYPYVRVTKMRGVPESTRFLLFKETDKGLFMESTRRVF